MSNICTKAPAGIIRCFHKLKKDGNRNEDAIQTVHNERSACSLLLSMPVNEPVPDCLSISIFFSL